MRTITVCISLWPLRNCVRTRAAHQTAEHMRTTYTHDPTQTRIERTGMPHANNNPEIARNPVLMYTFGGYIRVPAHTHHMRPVHGRRGKGEHTFPYICSPHRTPTIPPKLRALCMACVYVQHPKNRSHINWSVVYGMYCKSCPGHPVWPHTKRLRACAPVCRRRVALVVISLHAPSSLETSTSHPTVRACARANVRAFVCCV